MQTSATVTVSVSVAVTVAAHTVAVITVAGHDCYRTSLNYSILIATGRL